MFPVGRSQFGIVMLNHTKSMLMFLHNRPSFTLHHIYMSSCVLVSMCVLLCYTHINKVRLLWEWMVAWSVDVLLIKPN